MSSTKPRQVLFVTVDGPNGVGKSTVIQGLGRRLTDAGLPVHLTTEPSLTPLGDFVRSAQEFCDGLSLACLVAADRYYHLETDISPHLARGELVICDRYVESSLVLQRIDGVDRDFIWLLNQKVLRPDLSVVLLAEPEVIEARLTGRGRTSRFERPRGSSAAECQFYREAGEFLSARAGFNVFSVDCTAAEPDAIIEVLTSKIIDLTDQGDDL